MSVTHYPRIWLNSLFPPLRRWERAAIDAWMNDVDPETREIVQSQLRLINLAQRSAAGKVVELYYVKSGIALGHFDDRLSFAAGREEVVLGDVQLSINGRKIVCQLQAVNGRLFSLEFDQVPPLWLWRPAVHVTAVNASLRPIKPRPEDLQTRLPPDYVEILEGAPLPASTSTNVSLLSLDQIYASTFEEGRFWLFAEIPDLGMLGVKVESDDRTIYLLFYDGRRGLGLGTSLREALERARDLE